MRIEADSAYHDDPDGADPSWLGLIDDFRYEASKLNDKIEKLKEDQEIYIRLKSSALFDEGEKTLESVEEDMETKSGEISRSFNRLHSLVLEMKNLSSLRFNNKVLRNILQYEYKEVASLSEKLRNYHKKHLNRLNEKEKYMEQFVINFDDIDLNTGYSDHIASNTTSSLNHKNSISFEEEGSSSSVGFDNRNYRQVQDQLEVDFSDVDLLRERDQEMTSILKSMSELNTIFNEMNSLIVNQGSVMDRIDYNMEMIQMKVESGALELNRAERSARSARKLKCILILGGSILLTLFIMILQS